MIFCGFGKTSLIGNSVKLTENFVNILDCFRRCITRRYSKQLADELLVVGVKLIVTDGTDKGDAAQDELKELLFRICAEDSDVELTREKERSD